MSDSEMECTPPELRESAQQITLNLLPEKSKARYEKAYKNFREWCLEKGAQNFTSESVLLAYFGDATKSKKPSTMWALYSMLKSTISSKNNIDISKYAKLIAYLKKQNIGYHPRKSSIFTKQDVENFLKNAPFQFLPQKVWFIGRYVFFDLYYSFKYSRLLWLSDLRNMPH